MKKRSQIGFTLLEMMIAVGMLAILILAVVQLMSPINRFFQRSQARQIANLESRICIETIQRVMSNGKVSTLVVSTPSTNPPPPIYSEAQFSSTDGSSYTITWSTAPMNSVHLLRKAPGGVQTDTILGTHVTQLSFTLDLNNPVRVKVTLQITVPLNSSGAPDSFQTLLVDKHPVVMLAL